MIVFGLSLFMGLTMPAWTQQNEKLFRGGTIYFKITLKRNNLMSLIYYVICWFLFEPPTVVFGQKVVSLLYSSASWIFSPEANITLLDLEIVAACYKRKCMLLQFLIIASWQLRVVKTKTTFVLNVVVLYKRVYCCR